MRLAARWSSAPASAFTRSHRTCFVDHECAAHQILAMAGLNGPEGGGVVIDFHKPKPASLLGETVAHDGDRINRHAILGKEILQVVFVCLVRQVSHKKLLH